MFRYIIGAILIGFVAYFSLTSDTDEPVQKKTGVANIGEGKEKAMVINANLPVRWGPSPFGLGGATTPDPKEIILKRRQKMSADSLITPEDYFNMGIKQLSGLAESGDSFAMLQLAERYWSEADNLASDPDARVNEDSHKIAISYFEAAFRGGVLNIPVVLGKRAFESGDIIEAAAWDIMARHMGQNANSDFYARNNAFSNLSTAQMQAVGVRAKEISSKLGVPLL